MDDIIGRKFGAYEVLSQLGEGGMATVYLGRQESMDRLVAIKVIAAMYSRDEKFRARFDQEAHTIARLQHPHILPVIDYGEQDFGAYLVMRYVDSGTLEDRLREGPLTLDQTRDMLRKVAAALDYAHQAGVIHRDLKPANILLDEQDNPYLTDFGVARLLQSSQRLTQTGAAVGTPAYMAPEQWRADNVGPHTDLYALGVVLYEMVTGDQPFKADTTYSYMYKHVYEEPELPRRIMEQLPDEIEDVLLKSLAKDPVARYASGRAMADALDRVLTRGHFTPTRPVMMETSIGEPDPEVTAEVPTPPEIPFLRIVDTNAGAGTPPETVDAVVSEEATVTLGTPPESQALPTRAAASTPPPASRGRRGMLVGGLAAVAVFVIGMLIVAGSGLLGGGGIDDTPTPAETAPATTQAPGVAARPTTAVPPTETDTSLPPTATATATDTLTATDQPTYTPTDTPSLAASATLTVTPTVTQTPTDTDTPTATVTFTPSATATADVMATEMAAQVATSQQVVRNLTATANVAIIQLATNQAARTGTAIAVASFTATPTDTLMPSATDTATPTPTFTSTPSHTPTPTATATPTPTLTATITPRATMTPSATRTPSSTPTLTPTPTATPVIPTCAGLLPSRIRVGDTAVVNDEDPRPLNVRAGPGTQFARIGQLTVGTQFIVREGPECSPEYPWFEVQSLDDESLAGWVAESGEGVYFVSPLAGGLPVRTECEGILPTRLTLGGRAIVDTPTGQPLRLHDGPGTSAPITGLIPDGTRVTLLAGMVCTSDYSWWQYEAEDGRIGWSSEADNDSYFLAPLPN